MVKLNPEVEKYLEKNNIDVRQGIYLLFRLYFDTLELTDIDTSDAIRVTQYNFQLHPLLIDDDTDTGDLDWIKDEYIKLFKDRFPTLPPSKVSPSRTKNKMIQFMKDHPDVTKEEILQATMNYLSTQNSPTYVKQTDYFVFKGSRNSSEREDNLMDWIIDLRERKQQQTARTSLSDTIQ